MNVSQEYIDGRIAGAKPSHAWVGGSPEQIAEWQDRTRTRISQLLGIETFEACEPDIKFEAETVHEGVRRRALTFATRSDYCAFAYLLEPVEERDAGPAILCNPGHGAGVDAIVGLANEPYQAQFALEYARAGYRVLALEPFGFGHRKSSRNPEQPFSCGADSMAALMLGETLAGWRVWDSMRAIDVLRALPGVDPGRIGIAGISGGGLVSLWTAALDVRIKACVVSAYFCTFRDSILAVDHCPDNFVPGVLCRILPGWWRRVPSLWNRGLRIRSFQLQGSGGRWIGRRTYTPS